MNSNAVAFEILAQGAKPPTGQNKIPLRTIYEVKMDFTRKGRLVAGGHVTDPPSTMTYSSVNTAEKVYVIATP
jgi:hypothetical protein